MSSARPAPPQSSRHRTKRFSRSQLQHNLELILAAVSAPQLPPTLPLSPPASRSATPTPVQHSSSLSKRKLPQDSPSNTDQAKRPRTSLQQTDVHQDPARPAPQLPPDPHLASSSSSTVPVLVTAPTPGGPEPASFPHRRGKPSAADFTRFHERYSLHGKFFKYSAEIRGQAANAQDQRKLNPAPAPHSPYAVHAQLFSRIEAIDALLNFTYAMWCKDMVENKCHHALWDTIDQFLKWVRTRWETSETRGDAQRAFIGVIRMVEAYIYARKAAYLNLANARCFNELDKMVKAPPPATDSSSSISPATSLGGSSQHSGANASPPSAACPSPANAPAASRPAPAPPTSSHATSNTTVPHPHGSGVFIPRDLYDALQASHNCNLRSARAMAGAAIYLNLGTLARHFPRTSARVLAGQLRPDEEFEVDFDQDACSRADGVAAVGFGGDPSPGPGEGQLVWPGASNALNGEGVAWVCLLGRAMVREMAYPLGYRGLEGLLRKDAPPRSA